MALQKSSDKQAVWKLQNGFLSERCEKAAGEKEMARHSGKQKKFSELLSHPQLPLGECRAKA